MYQLKSKYLLLIQLVLFYSIALTTLIIWEKHNIYSVTGDEPHYIVMADGIINYGTLEQSIPYKNEFMTKKIYKPGLAPSDAVPTPQNTHAVQGPHGLYNVHNIGLPILISIPYKIGGVLGVKLFLIAISGLIALGSWIASGFFTNKKFIRLATTSAISLGYPFIPAANQVYPDVIAGIISMFVILYLIKRSNTIQDVRNRDFIILAIFIAFMPWLQIKFTAAALIAVLAVLYSEFKSNRSHWRLIFLVFIFSVSILLLIAYNLYAFGKATGPYQQGALELSPTSIMVFVGLHLDRFQGILFQNPIYFTGILYLASFLRKFRFAGITFILMYAALVVPNAMHPIWYGGGSFAGRFEWSGAIAMIPLVIYALNEIVKNYPRIGIFLISSTIIFNAYTFTLYSSGKLDLYNKPSITWLSNYPSFFGPIAEILPALYNSTWAYTFFPNYVWTFIVLGLLVAGQLIAIGLPKERIIPITMTGLFTSLVLLVLSTQTTMLPPEEPITYSAIQLPSQTGRIDGDKRIASPELDQPGFLTYGPYIDLPAGKYVATIKYKSDSDHLTHIGWVDVTSSQGTKVLTKIDLKGTANIPGYVELPFVLDSKTEGIEVRYWYDAVSKVELYSIEIRRSVNEN